MKYIKNNEKSVQKYRFWIQVSFAALCVWIGVEFYFFVRYLETAGAQGSFYRPPGVDGFLPISSMMNVYYFFLSGEIHSAHPAGFFIFLAILAVSLIFGKSFCSWFCPIGFISELIGDFGEKIQKKLFKKVYKLPKFLDYPLRSLKYLLLAFFAYAIFFTMTEASLKYFLSSPYNVVSDVKMFYFFADISRFALTVIFALFILSIAVRNFWCRYLCPYGALLGLISFLSPSKIKRDKNACIDCGLCSKACPSRIKVDKIKTVYSDECASCLSCVDACPVKDALQVKTVISEKKINKKIIGFAIVLIFVLIAGAGMISGKWQNKISKAQYFMIYENIDRLDHPKSAGDMDKLNKKIESGKSSDNSQTQIIDDKRNNF